VTFNPESDCLSTIAAFDTAARAIRDVSVVAMCMVCGGLELGWDVVRRMVD
jgi:hypothetical protein